MKSQMRQCAILGILLWFVAVFICGCNPRLPQKEMRFLMGTVVEVTSSDRRAAEIVFGEISRIENLLSKYKEYSEISQLNKKGRLKVSPETLYIIKKAKELYELSGGVFDITVAPLLDVWGFSQRQYRIPPEREIKNTLKLVGSEKIIIDDKKNEIRFKIKGMSLDLGAIAKGYAVDCAIKKLKEAGVKSALVNAGGDMYCLSNKDGRPWRIAIKNPRGEGFTDYLELSDKAVATSGDYEQFFIAEGRRFSHIFNPKTGYPADAKVVSVTVVADDCLTADALATAIFVLGKDKAAPLLKKFAGVEARIIE
ncbi:MAG: FAD:protein FMN transferase [Candidatus Omnitrophica bacterium]|nr:FAD:protein FMN transferase [Candidatus Omnitrophota bacterium]